MSNAPCYQCPDRHNLCHSSRAKYLAFRAERDAINQQSLMDSVLYDGRMRSKCWKVRTISGDQ